MRTAHRRVTTAAPLSKDPAKLSLDDGDCFLDLVRRDNKRWCETNDVLVCRLRKQARILEGVAQVASSLAVCTRLDDHRVQEPAPANRRHGGVANAA